MVKLIRLGAKKGRLGVWESFHDRGGFELDGWFEYFRPGE